MAFPPAYLRTIVVGCFQTWEASPTGTLQLLRDTRVSDSTYLRLKRGDHLKQLSGYFSTSSTIKPVTLIWPTSICFSKLKRQFTHLCGVFHPSVVILL